MSKRKRLKHIALDEDFCMQFKIMAAANNKSIAQFSRDLAKQKGSLKEILERFKL